MMASRAAIIGAGAVTPIGQGAWAATAAARAGLCGFGHHPYVVDSAGMPVRVACVPWLEHGLTVVERCTRMLLPALEEALGNARPKHRIPLAIGLPRQRPGREADLADQLCCAVDERFGNRFGPVATYETGHAASLQALEASLAGLENGAVDACVVAGVDSHLAAETLEWLDACDQLHGGGALNNAWGFIPGEAAGAIVLQRPTNGAQAALAEVVAVGSGRETRLIKTNDVCIGAGLTQAFRDALRPLPPEARIDEIYCDMNGEAYRADEYGFACLRTRERFRAATDFNAAADCWGDLGAAGAMLHVLQAITACRKGYARGPLGLVWASSEGGERGAAVLAAPVARRE